jgi:hypothetical protein
MLRSVGFHDLHSSSVINKMFESRRVGCSEHVARTAEKRNLWKTFMYENLNEGSRLENCGVGVGIILKCILNK